MSKHTEESSKSRCEEDRKLLKYQALNSLCQSEAAAIEHHRENGSELEELRLDATDDALVDVDESRTDGPEVQMRIASSEEVLARLARLCDGRPGLYAELHGRDEVLEVLFGLLATYDVLVE